MSESQPNAWALAFGKPYALTLSNTYAALGAQFAAPTQPTPVKAPSWIAFNEPLAKQLGLSVHPKPAADDAAGENALLDVFAGNALWPQSQPVAQAYAGHQFGHFNPQLGDGRTILLGELVTPAGLRKDLQLKGAGITPFSRRGDGRAALGPVLREYLLSEAMHTLNIPTTRALAAVATGQPVYRERSQPGAVLTRVAASHIRIGTFEFFARQGKTAEVKTLSDYVIARHYPHCAQAANPYRALFEAVMAAQIHLVTRWLSVGFIHGVMNTDNMSIAGETIDYGPCAFMDAYNPATVYSAIDTQGRYAYARQKPILQWNLARLAECLLPLLGRDTTAAVSYAEDVLTRFTAEFDQAYNALMASKIGLHNTAAAQPEEQSAAQLLVTRLLALLQQYSVDYTQAFRELGNLLLKQNDESKVTEQNEESWIQEQNDKSWIQRQNVKSWIQEQNEESWMALFGDAALSDAQQWLADWRAALAEQGEPLQAVGQRMQTINPSVIARNYQVEAVIQEAIALHNAAANGEPVTHYPKFEALQRALQTPFDAKHEGTAFYYPPALAVQQSYQTFCGT